MTRRYLDNAGMPDTTYNVVRGDTLWDIANRNGISLDELRSYNPNLKGDVIHPDDIINIAPQYEERLVNLRNERIMEEMYNQDNISAIQGAKHDRNYVIVDKKSGTLTVYDKQNNPIYQSKGISTGASGDDYNTITYVNPDGSIRNKAGNNSTPAGITTIKNVGLYHGSPSFIRARGQEDGLEDIASSIHLGNVSDKKSSNGCIRADAQTLEHLSQLVGAGTKVYTLPEKEGSKFSLKGGKLHFIADNPYGETEGSKKYWDDYNVQVDKSYSPLQLRWNKTGNDKLDKNIKQYAQSLVNNKQKIQKQFGLTSDEYNRFAEMALGLAAQESMFGIARSYQGKKNTRSIVGDDIMDNIVNPIGRAINQLRHGQLPHNLGDAASRGYTQIKLKGDNDEMRSLYNTLGITGDNIDSPTISALATVARLAQMYNTEVRGRTFTGEGDEVISPYDALLYKWNGHNEQLTNHTATPSKNKYLRSVKGYANNFRMFERRRYRK